MGMETCAKQWCQVLCIFSIEVTFDFRGMWANLLEVLEVLIAIDSL